MGVVGKGVVGVRGGQNAAPQETFLTGGEGVSLAGEKGYKVWPLEGGVFFCTFCMSEWCSPAPPLPLLYGVRKRNRHCTLPVS